MSSSDVEMEENRGGEDEENRREGREESSRRERRTTTRVDDDVEMTTVETIAKTTAREDFKAFKKSHKSILEEFQSKQKESCLLYTSPSPRDATLSRMPSSA